MTAPADRHGGEQLDYLVERDEEHWTVSYQGDHCGRFPSRVEALRSAVADAQRVQERGYPIKVWIRREDGRLRQVRGGLLGAPQPN